MYSVLVRLARGKGIFVAVNVNDGCWGNYNMRGLRLFCFLSVRGITFSFSFCDGAFGFLVGWNCNIEERLQLVLYASSLKFEYTFGG